MEKIFYRTIVLLLAIAASPVTFSQSLTVKGRILDKSKTAIPFANVIVQNSYDSSAVAAMVANEKGEFEITCTPSGQMILLVSRIGYKDHRQSLNNAGDTSRLIILPDIELEADSKSLQSVTVQAKKPLVQFKPDRTVLNIANSINAVGTSAFELLRKAPGVLINNEDNIVINGKKGMTVYIDGKPSNLSGKDLIDFLKSTPSSNIESIEIITNPGAEFDAAGNAGIVNIRTRANMNFGFNANASLTAQFGSYNPKYDAAITLNYRNKKYNFYGNYNVFTGKYRSVSSLFQRQGEGANAIYFDNPYTNYNNRNANNFKAGLDYTIGKRSNIGVVVNGNLSYSHAYKEGRNTIYKNNNSIDSILYSTSDQPQDVDRLRYNANYRYTDTMGTTFSIDADYGSYISRANSYLLNRYVDVNEQFLSDRDYKNNSESDIDIRSAKADLQKRLFKGTFGAGVKFSQIKSDNDLVFYNVYGNISKPDTGRTNKFVYHESIRAAYVNYNRTIKKFTYRLGLRAEHTSVKGELTTLNVSNQKTLDSNYLNFFPNALVTYQANRNNSFSLGYNRRIDRPFYGDLNPFEFVVNELLFSKGNPFLKPQYTSVIKLSHTYKQKLTTSITYDHIRDYMSLMSDTLGDKRTFIGPINIAAKKIIGVHVSYAGSFTRWWEFNIAMNARRDHVTGAVRNNNYLDQAQNAWDIFASNTFTISKTFSAELSGFYNSRQMDAPAIIKPQWSMDAGIRKRLLHDDLTLGLAVSDIFNSLNSRVVRDYGGLFFNGRLKWETRVLRLSASFRFGNKNVKKIAERSSGAEDELRRIR